jgi:hypothetical protein
MVTGEEVFKPHAQKNLTTKAKEKEKVKWQD